MIESTKTVGPIAWGIAASLIIVAVVLLHLGGRLNIESNILRLLPVTESDPAIELAFDNFSEINMRQLLFLVANSDKEAAKQAADQLSDALSENIWIEQVSLDISSEEQEEIARFSYDYRNHLLTLDDEKLLQNADYQSFADEVIEQIYAPFSGPLVDLLETDPFLLSYRFAMANSDRVNQTLTMDDGYLLTNTDGIYYVFVTAQLSQSPFNQGLQKQVLTDIDVIEQQLTDSRLIRTGALFYTAYAYDMARGEITTIGGSSLALIVVLVILTFLSITPVLMVSLALAFGIGLGFTVVRLLFGEVHLLTFVFGASLIGVAVDYAFHFFAVDAHSGSARLSRIFPAISLGLLSSIIGYLALLTTPFPGLKQMATFSITGLVGAYLTVVLLFPALPFNSQSSPPLLALCRRFLNMGASKAAQFLLMIALTLPLIAWFMPEQNDSSVDDVRQFQAQDPVLLEQETTINRVLNSPAANQFYLVRGAEPETLLQNLEQANLELEKLVDAGIIDNYITISQWLPSIQRQKQNYALYQRLFQSNAINEMIDFGVTESALFAAARESFRDDAENYLTPEHWLDSPLGQQMSYLWLGRIEQNYVAVIALQGINDLTALGDLGPDMVFVDKVTKISELLRAYRERAWVLLLVAVVAIYFVLLLRYGLKKASLVLSSPVIAISATVVILQLLGEAFSLFNTLALFLVIGIGIDFGIFFAEARQVKPHTLLAVLLSALTTLFSFGLLSLSETTVIHSFGLTMLIGIGTTFLLSPIVGNLVAVANETSK